MDRNLTDKLMKLLEKDIARNINMINFIRNYSIHTMDIQGESAMIRGKSDEDWVYISSESLGEFLRLIEGLTSADRCFAVLEDWMLPYIVKDREVRSRLTSMKLVYDGTRELPPEKHAAAPLTVEDAGYVFENSKYKEYISIEYIEDRIRNGVALGIREGGRLAAWAITHDDGAVGFLHVLEDYRGKGYGTDVTVSMVKRLLDMGELPFVHIEEHNVKSMNLAFKAGFCRDRRIHWFKLD